MVNNTFSQMIRKHFEYLINEYHFSIREEYYGSEPFGDALIEFWSSTTIVSIRLDRLDIIVLIGPFGEEEAARLSLEVIIDFLTHGEIKLLNTSVNSRESFESRIEFLLKRYAYLLRQYCDPILRGDFSIWLDALRYFITIMQNNYRSLTGLDLPLEAYKSIEEYIKLRERK
jgi:hypothetical protein